MIRSTHNIIAAIPHRRTPGGDAESIATLARTVDRLSHCAHLHRIVVMHPASRPAPALPWSKKLISFEITGDEATFEDAMRPARLAARRWCPTSWRGGLGGATVWDEPLAAASTLTAMTALDAAAALIVGEDWPLIDPALCDAVIDRHLNEPDHLQLVFTQAAPGLSPCLITRDLLAELRDKQAMIGTVLAYNPVIPQGDPIGKDPCVQITPAVRDLRARLIADSPRWRSLIHRITDHDADASHIAAALAPHVTSVHDAMPQQVTIEINIDRIPTGPIVPQHHTDITREPMSVETARNIFRQLAATPDVAVTLGGLGDPLLHPQWREIVDAARDAGLSGLHIETDLIVEPEVMPQIAASHIDVVSIRLNADTAGVYEQLMGVDAFDRVIRNIEQLRMTRADGLPWIVPRMCKTADNVHELESFFDRWIYFCGHAVIESPATGCGSMPDLSVLNMAPPARIPCRQLAHRMTLHAGGRPAVCDQTWRDDHDVEALPADVSAAWAQLRDLHAAHRAGRYDACSACTTCTQWHRP